MKALHRPFQVLLILGLSVLATGCEPLTFTAVNGELPAELQPYTEQFVGKYAEAQLLGESERRIEISLQDKRLVLTSNFDLTGMDCESSAGALQRVRVFVNESQAIDPTGSFNAIFRLNKSRCPWIQGNTITFTHGKRLTGSDYFRVSVLIRKNTLPLNPRNRSNEQLRLWSFTKIP